jgi:hypothetical protein
MAKWWLLDSSFLRFYEFLNNFTVQAKYLFIYTALEKKKKKNPKIHDKEEEDEQKIQNWIWINSSDKAVFSYEKLRTTL